MLYNESLNEIEFVGRHLRALRPRYFSEFYGFCMYFLLKFIKKLSTSKVDLNELYQLFLGKHICTNIDEWLDKIMSMVRSDKGYYLSYYLMCVNKLAISKNFLYHTPIHGATTSLSPELKVRIWNLVHNMKILDIYCTIINMGENDIFENLGNALVSTFTVELPEREIAGYTASFPLIYIKFQKYELPLINDANIIIIFLHEFTHYLKRVNST